MYIVIHIWGLLYGITGKVGGGKFGELTFLSIWQKKVWRINRSANIGHLLQVDVIFLIFLKHSIRFAISI